jgi:hypothetical protein
MDKSAVFGFVGTLLLIGAAPAWGQAVYGSVVGTVTDASGAAVPGAKITITDVARGVSFTTLTNETGNYTQSHLIVGLYEVHVDAVGFSPYVGKNISVEVDATTRVDIRVTTGDVHEEVNVTGESPLLKTDRADVSDTVTQRVVMELPVLSRDVNRIYLLIPGVQANGTTTQAEQPQDVYRPSMSGQPWGGITFLLDGAENREPVLGEPVISPNIDALAELRITLSAYDAELPQASQGVVSMQTKSGTNDWHGGAFWFRRDADTAARDPFAQSLPLPGTTNQFVPKTLWNQFGASLGGPIQTNKTFIFGDFQGLRQANGASLLERVPTVAERNGDLSDLGVPIFNPCAGTNCNIAPAQRQQFTGGVIPGALLSPQAQALLAYLPLPNIPNATGASPNYAANGTGVENGNNFDVRVDRYQTEKLHVFTRYSMAQYSGTAPGAFGLEAGGPDFPVDTYAGSSWDRNQSAVVGIDYPLSSKWLVDFRMGYLRYNVFVEPNGLGTTPAKDAGIPGVSLDNFYTSGMPGMSLTGTGGVQFGYSLAFAGCNCPEHEFENQFQWTGNVTHIMGNHSLKFGPDFRFLMNTRIHSNPHRSGDWTYSPTTTEGPNGGGLSLATFLLGDVSSFVRGVAENVTAKERQHRFFSYIQDTWRVTPKLTVNYGTRWEIYFPQYVNGKDQGGFPDLATGQDFIAGENGVSLNGNAKTALTHLAPRAGIAYQLTPTTVIRSGYGRSYDTGVFGNNFGHNTNLNLPVLASQSLNPANPWLPVFTLAQGPPNLSPSGVLASQPLGPNGSPMWPDGVAPWILPWNQDRTLRLPKVDGWNLTVEHQFASNLVLSVGYVGNEGSDITANYNINAPTIVGFGTLSTNQRRPFYQKYGWTESINYFGDDHSDHFESLQVRAERRFKGGLNVQSNFTWGSAFNYATDYLFWNSAIDYGRESGFRTKVFNANFIYELPFGKGKPLFGGSPRAVRSLLSNWELSGILVWESGLPFTPSYADCGKDEDTGPCRANLVGDASVPNPGPQEWFAPAPAGTSATGCTASSTPTAELNANGCTRGSWSRPAAGTFGNVAYDSFFGPHFANLDTSLTRSFNITEKITAQIRAESFNTLNHVNLGQPNSVVDSGIGGQITSLASLAQMRRWQFAVRIKF